MTPEEIRKGFMKYTNGDDSGFPPKPGQIREKSGWVKPFVDMREQEASRVVDPFAEIDNKFYKIFPNGTTAEKIQYRMDESTREMWKRLDAIQARKGVEEAREKEYLADHRHGSAFPVVPDSGKSRCPTLDKLKNPLNPLDDNR